MPGAVPLNDLPQELRGTAVPEDDLPAVNAGGGPQHSRRYVTNQERSAQGMADWNKLPLMARMSLAPDEIMPGGMEARNKANADAGAILGNAIENSTVNLPGNILGFGAKVAGQVGRNIDPSIDPNSWRDAVASRTTLPTSEHGQQLVSEALAPTAQKIQAFLDRHPVLGAAAETGGTLLEGAGILGGARGAMNAVEGMGARSTAAELAHKPYTRAPVAEAAKRYTILPEDAQHSAGMPTQSNITGSTRAGLGAKVTSSEVPIANARAATANATADLPGQLLDANGRVDGGLLRKALDEQSVPYQQVAQLPAPQANTLAPKLREAWDTRGGSLKGDAVVESRLGPLMDPSAPPLPTDELLRRWREVNGYASELRKASGEGSAAAQIKGQDLRGIADSLLNEIDDRAAAFGTPDLVQSLKEARVNIARLHTLDDSLDSVGWVDPSKLAAMADRHVPLTGGLAQVATDAAAAPRSLAPMGRAVDAQGNELDQFGRHPESWIRNVIGHIGGNALARQGVEKLNQELRAGGGLLKQPVGETPVPPLMPPNTGPQMPPQPPQAPGGLFADQIPGPSGGPTVPSAGRPEPGQMPFNQLLADRMAGDLSLEGAAAPAQPGAAPQGRPLDQLDFTPPEASGVPGNRGAPMTQDQWRLSDALQLEAPPEPFAKLGIPAPQFGPGDEFPGPSGGGSPGMLFRGVPEGADPNVPNDRGFTTWSNQRDVAQQYGPNIGETPFDPQANVHLGTLEDARQLFGLGPEATAQDIAAAAVQKFLGANRTASYDLPAELSGTPREFIRFGQ